MTLHLFSMLTSHFMTLLFVAEHPDARIRDIAKEVDITERRVAEILTDLAQAEFISVEHQGRRNHYTVNHRALFPHPLVGDIPVGAFLSLISCYRDASRSGEVTAEGKELCPLQGDDPLSPSEVLVLRGIAVKKIPRLKRSPRGHVVGRGDLTTSLSV